jgi:chitinase
MTALRASAAALLAAALLSACDSDSSSGTRACDGPVPVAIAGPDRTVARGTQVVLEGSGGGGDGAVAFAWRLDATPPGSGAALGSATGPRPTFTADAPGVYVATLVVSDACATSTPDTTVIVVPNAAPVAVAGAEQSVDPGAEVALDGGGSQDADGDPLTFTWTLAARPSGSAAALSGASTRTPTFATDVAGTYVVLLVVSDGYAQSAPSPVTIHAGDGGVPGCAPAARPVANAGSDQTGSSWYANLSGGGSTSSRPGLLTYRWSLVSAPAGAAGSISSPTSVYATLNADGAGVYVITLVVHDGCQDSLPDSVTITIPNEAPSLYLGSSNRSVPTGKRVDVSASAHDPNGDVVMYAWTLVSKPAASAAALASASTNPTSFVPDVDGDYVVSVVASDGERSSPTAILTVTASNTKPVAKAGVDRTADLGASVALNGSASSDDNGTALTFTWTLASRPAGSAAALGSPDAAVATFVPDLEGVYVARLVVSDGVLSASDDVTIAVWPALQKLAARVVDAEYSGALERIVAVSVDPKALRLLDPRTLAETEIGLSLAPSSVSVSPDGLRAAVGHTNAISIVELETRAVRTITVTVDVADVALAGNGWVYATARNTGGERTRMTAVRLDTGVEISGISNQSGTVRLKVRPGDAALYASGGNSSSVERYDITAGAPVLAGATSDGYYYSTCGDLWLSEAGTRVFTRCGAVYRASSAPSEDLTFAGSLKVGVSSYGSFTARHVSDSTAAGEVSAITGTYEDPYSSYDDLALRRYESGTLGLLDVAPFPAEVVNGNTYRWRGRYVFYRSDGTERYVIAQLDPGSGALVDFGIATF